MSFFEAHCARRACALMFTAVVSLAICATPARADHSMETIVQDDAVLLDRSDSQVATAMAKLAALGVTRVRLTASWSTIAPQPDSSTVPQFDAEDPNAYPPHAWDRLDRAVRDAAADGLRVDIDIAFWAPLWATSDTTATYARRYPDPMAYARFAQAVARRYSGSFVPAAQPPASSPPPLVPVALGDGLPVVGNPLSPPSQTQSQSGDQTMSPPPSPLPRVDMYTIWNEPNWGGFLEPQWVQNGGEWQAEAPEIYRRLVYAAYPAIKQVDPGSTVLVGGTASTGGSPGADSIRPLEFIRTLACVDTRLRPLTTPECQNFQSIPGDGWAHHPYEFGGTPGQATVNPDDATIAELPRLTRLLERLVEMRRLSPGLRDVWITEFGYPTNSRLTWTHLTEAQQAQFMAWGEFIAWSTPHVRSFAQFLLQDVPGYETGLYQADGAPKLAAQTFATPLWAQYPLYSSRDAVIARPAGVSVWLHLRAVEGPTEVRLEALRTNGSWQPMRGTAAWGSPPGVQATQFSTDPHGYLLVRLSARGPLTLRAQVLLPSGWQANGSATSRAIRTPLPRARRVSRHRA